MPDGSEFPRNSNVPPINLPARQLLPAKFSSPQQTTLHARVCDSRSRRTDPLRNSLQAPSSSKDPLIRIEVNANENVIRFDLPPP
jgi:hypothetical protein